MWLRQIRVSVALWSSNKRDDSPLLRGSVLADANRWVDGRRDELSESEQEFIKASQIADERLQSQAAFLRDAMQSLGVVDVDDREAIRVARMKKLREFASRVPDGLPEFRSIVGMFAESLGLEPLHALEQLSPQYSTITPESTGDVGRSDGGYAKSFIVLASTGAREPAFSDNSGSFFGRFFAVAISGKAADNHGLVTAQGVYEYIQHRMETETSLLAARQRPLIQFQGRVSEDFPITATSKEKLRSGGKRKAILAASDHYQDSHLTSLRAAESLIEACVPELVNRGGFEVSLLTGSQMTRERLTYELMKAAHDSGPNDALLFYFSGHGGYSAGTSGSLELFLVDSVPGQLFSSLSVRDLGETLRKSGFGTTIIVLDASYAGSAFSIFQ